MASPGAVGAVCASSRHLAARMAAHVEPDGPAVVLELGGGTGAITAALLARGVPPGRLVVVEHAAPLARHLRQRFAGVHVIHGDAAELALLRQRPGWPADGQGQPLPVGHIVSSLPLLSIPPAARGRILAAGRQALAPDGRLVQFTYALRGPSPWQQAGLAVQVRERVLRNLPPARVDVLRHG